MGETPAKLPKVLSFVNQKGGAGKSTGAVHAVDWFTQKGFSVVLVDADGQQSSSSWSEELSLPHKVISDPEALFDELPKLAENHDVVIVDGPGNASEVTKAVLIRSNLVLIPCRDSMIDLASTGKIVQFVRQAKEIRGGLPVSALYLNAVKENTILLREAKEALQSGILPLLQTALPDRQCIKDSPGQASTVFRMKGSSAKSAADSFNSLFVEALKLFEAES
ncbi:ParA family protein [Oscillatoria sp. FACHB-1407]|uniref:ParA family protein n=1 Tax=Oscillatoria sp. FACHB-1407 TaxID=2692847 RepID=UPI0016893A94|nr:ParA family protein [Oscillatoria sp. FACHB-1407]MBD2463064.1 ParA family protein [Oscillatoria sp. FACHB-1407]